MEVSDNNKIDILKKIRSFEYDKNRKAIFGIKSAIVWGHSKNTNYSFPMLYISKPKNGECLCRCLTENKLETINFKDMNTSDEKQSNGTNIVLDALRYAISQIETEKNVAKIAIDDDYKKGYLKALTNVTAILDEYVIKKHGI